MQADLDNVRTLVQSGHTDAALRRLAALTATHPKDAQLWREFGVLLATVGRDEEALTAFTQSTWIIGRDVGTWIAMAVSAHRVDRHKDSVTYWRTALDLDPELFKKSPHYAVLWRESRTKHSDYDDIVRRISKRGDLEAAFYLLRSVAHVEDVEFALLAIGSAGGKQSTALRVATATLRLAQGDALSAPALIDAVTDLAPDVREETWVKLLTWLLDLSGADTDQSMNALVEQTEEAALLRAAYRVAPTDSPSYRESLVRLASRTLEALRRINSAA